MKRTMDQNLTHLVAGPKDIKNDDCDKLEKSR